MSSSFVFSDLSPQITSDLVLIVEPATHTDHESGYLQPFCQNCKTQTTPLWRRDEIGSVLCNACGLFLKLHKTARPISLKTDVIKSRNRVKTAQAQRKRVSVLVSLQHSR